MENGGLTLNAFQRKEYSEFSFIHDEMDKIDQKKKMTFRRKQKQIW